MNKKIIKHLKKIISVFLSFCLIINFAYAKNVGPDTGDVDKDFLKKHSKEEWYTLQDYDIHFEEIPLMVEYFSPTYLQYYNSAYLTASGTMGAYGVDNSVVKALKNSVTALDESISSIQKTNSKEEASKLINDLGLIETRKSVYNSSSSVNKTFSNIYLTVGNNNQLMYLKFSVIKGLETAFTSYKLLERYEKLLEKQKQLYLDIYNLTLTNKSLGLATEIDEASAYSKYVISNANYENMKTQLFAVRFQLGLALGFSFNEIDMLNFIEPEIDIEYLININRDADNAAAYNSNTAYRASSLTDFNKKAGSRYEQREEYREYLKNKIILEMDKLYYDIEIKHKDYDASLVSQKIYNINYQAFYTKKINGLLSNSASLGLELSLLNDEISIISAKYNFINAISNYKYAVLGVTNIN